MHILIHNTSASHGLQLNVLGRTSEVIVVSEESDACLSAGHRLRLLGTSTLVLGTI
jgi:hypothetical protein